MLIGEVSPTVVTRLVIAGSYQSLRTGVQVAGPVGFRAYLSGEINRVKLGYQCPPSTTTPSFLPPQNTETNHLSCFAHIESFYEDRLSISAAEKLPK